MEAELKRENHHLKRALTRLRKQLDQAEFFVPEEEAVLDERAIEAQTPCCPNCGSADLLEVPIPSGKVLMGCRNCQWRRD